MTDNEGSSKENGNGEQVAKPEEATAVETKQEASQEKTEDNEEVSRATRKTNEGTPCPDTEEADEEYKDLDEDEIAANPAYIPKVGKFYMHDDYRTVTGESETLERDEQDDKKKSRADGVWKHDKFDEKSQGPKSKKQIVTKYGFDIRSNGKIGNEDEEQRLDGDITPPESQQRPKKERIRGKKGQKGSRKKDPQQNIEERKDGSGKQEAIRLAEQLKTQATISGKKKEETPKRDETPVDGVEVEEEDLDLRRGQRRVTRRIEPEQRREEVPSRSSSRNMMRGGRRGSNLRGGGRGRFQQTNQRTRRDYRKDEQQQQQQPQTERLDDNHRRGVIRGGGRGQPRNQQTRQDRHGQSGREVPGEGEQQEPLQQQPRNDYQRPPPQTTTTQLYNRPTYPVQPQQKPRGYHNGGGDFHHGPPIQHQHHVIVPQYPAPRGGGVYKSHRGAYVGPPQQVVQPMMVMGPPQGAPPPPPQIAQGQTYMNIGGGGSPMAMAPPPQHRPAGNVVYFNPNQQVRPSAPPKREKKILPIVNPDTQK